MPFPREQLEQIDATLMAYLEAVRPPVHARPQLDYAYTIAGSSVLLQDVRPRYNDATKIMVTPFAKATYVKSHNIWRVYWARADQKWHPYAPTPEVATLEKFLALEQEDQHGCFHG